MSSVKKSYTLQVQASVEEHWSTAIRSAHVTLSLLSAFETEGIQEVDEVLVSLRNLVKGGDRSKLPKSNQEREKQHDHSRAIQHPITNKEDIKTSGGGTPSTWQEVDFDNDPIFNKRARKKQSISEAKITSTPSDSLQKAPQRQQQQQHQQQQHQQIQSNQLNYQYQQQPKLSLKQLIEFDDHSIQLERSTSSTNTSSACSSSIIGKSSGQSSTKGFEHKPSKVQVGTVVPKESTNQTYNSKWVSQESSTGLLESELISKLEAWKLKQDRNVSQAKQSSGGAAQVSNAADPDDNWTKPEERPDTMTVHVPTMPIRKKPPGPRTVHPDAGDTESEGEDEQDI
ncbi:hypothetical protein MBANPS3_001114 [Mucor bainieri]